MLRSKLRGIILVFLTSLITFSINADIGRIAPIEQCKGEIDICPSSSKENNHFINFTVNSFALVENTGLYGDISNSTCLLQAVEQFFKETSAEITPQGIVRDYEYSPFAIIGALIENGVKWNYWIDLAGRIGSWTRTLDDGTELEIYFGCANNSESNIER